MASIVRGLTQVVSGYARRRGGQRKDQKKLCYVSTPIDAVDDEWVYVEIWANKSTSMTPSAVTITYT